MSSFVVKAVAKDRWKAVIVVDTRAELWAACEGLLRLDVDVSVTVERVVEMTEPTTSRADYHHGQ